jgi:hypothetical protein
MKQNYQCLQTTKNSNNKKLTRATRILILIVLAVYSTAGSVMGQCAMCKQAASSSLDKDPTSLAKNLNTGILYLMAVPYILIAFIFRKQLVSLYRNWRGKETKEEVI